MCKLKVVQQLCTFPLKSDFERQLQRKSLLNGYGITRIVHIFTFCERRSSLRLNIYGLWEYKVAFLDN